MWVGSCETIFLMPIEIETTFSKSLELQQPATIVDMFSNIVIEITQTSTSDWVQFGSVKLSFPCEIAIERLFQNVFCFSACWYQVLVNFQYGFCPHPSANDTINGFCSRKTMCFHAYKGTNDFSSKYFRFQHPATTVYLFSNIVFGLAQFVFRLLCWARICGTIFSMGIYEETTIWASFFVFDIMQETFICFQIRVCPVPDLFSRCLICVHNV